MLNFIGICCIVIVIFLAIVIIRDKIRSFFQQRKYHNSFRYEVEMDELRARRKAGCMTDQGFKNQKAHISNKYNIRRPEPK